MAFDYYQGVDGLWLAANFESAAIPVDADDLIVPAGIQASIDGSDQKGIRLNIWELARGFRGNVGSSGDPFIIDVVKMVHRGSGSLWLKSDDNASTEFTVWVLIDSDNKSNAASLNGEKMDHISVQKGYVHLLGTLGTVALPSLVDISYRNNPSDDAEVLIDCGLLAATGTLNQMAGKCISNAAVPIAYISGGIYTHSDTNSTVITTLFVSGTGITRYNSRGTMVTANILKGGTLDLTRTDLVKTITTINLFPGGTLIYNPDTAAIGTFNDLGGMVVKLRDAPAPFGGGAFGS